MKRLMMLVMLISGVSLAIPETAEAGLFCRRARVRTCRIVQCRPIKTFIQNRRCRTVTRTTVRGCTSTGCTIQSAPALPAAPTTSSAPVIVAPEAAPVVTSEAPPAPPAAPQPEAPSLATDVPATAPVPDE
jgi:hypothetical protein